jgi:hypothetical protein
MCSVTRRGSTRVPRLGGESGHTARSPGTATWLATGHQVPRRPIGCGEVGGAGAPERGLGTDRAFAAATVGAVGVPPRPRLSRTCRLRIRCGCRGGRRTRRGQRDWLAPIWWPRCAVPAHVEAKADALLTGAAGPVFSPRRSRALTGSSSSGRSASSRPSTSRSRGYRRPLRSPAVRRVPGSAGACSRLTPTITSARRLRSSDRQFVVYADAVAHTATSAE